VDRVWRYSLTAFMHLQQPLARLIGRIQHGLVPWRRRGPDRKLWRLRTRSASWRQTWKSPEARLEGLFTALRSSGAVTWRGGDWDEWDLAVRGGFLGGARLRMGVEEHGGGAQLLRFSAWACMPVSAVFVVAALAALGAGALAGGAVVVGAVLLAAAAGVLATAGVHVARALGALEQARPAAEAEISAPAKATPVAPASATAWAPAAIPLPEAAGREH
jgi:hypothetical protein